MVQNDTKVKPLWEQIFQKSQIELWVNLGINLDKSVKHEIKDSENEKLKLLENEQRFQKELEGLAQSINWKEGS